MKQQTKNVLLAFVLFLFSFTITIINPFGGNFLNDELKLIFTFIGGLFAILSGFFIASLWDRFTKIRTLISAESASLENLYKFYELVDKKIARKMAEKIDRYIIKSLEFELHEYQENLREEYFSLYEQLKFLKGKRGSTIATRILSIFDQFTKDRKEILSRGKDKLGIYHWTALILLAFLLISMWAYIQFNDIAGIVIGTIFIFAVFIVLVIVYDLNNLNWGSEQVNIEVYERVYDVMGMLRYYPEELLNRINIPDDIKEYRIGILVDKENYKRKIKKVINI